MSTKKKYNKSNTRNKTFKHTSKKGIKFITINDILKESQQNEKNSDNCHNHDNNDKMGPVFDTFEDKYEADLKEKNIDILKQNYKLEKKTIHDIHEALNNKKYNPVNDFYSYINDRWIKTVKFDE